MHAVTGGGPPLTAGEEEGGGGGVFRGGEGAGVAARWPSILEHSSGHQTARSSIKILKTLKPAYYNQLHPETKCNSCENPPTQIRLEKEWPASHFRASSSWSSYCW